MSVLQRMYRGETNFDFVGSRRRYFAISAAALLISLASLAVRGVDLGVDFVGGTVVEAPNAQGLSLEEVRADLRAIGQEAARVQLTGTGDGIRIQTVELTEAQLQRLVDTVADIAGVSVGEVSSQEVGPTFGAQVAESAARALVIFLIVVTIFISIRFEWRMALTALAALLHDLTITAGVYSLTGFEVTPASVIAILTILGYSLYDTVVVFDKIEEQIEVLHDKHTITGIVNLSMNQVLMRSINTSLTSLLPVGSLLFVGSYLLGATTLREFALALFVGIGAGTYSSIFFASPLLAVWKEQEEDWQRARRRVERRRGPVEAADVPDQAPVPVAAVAPAEDDGVVTVFSGATPRPPKRRRRKR